MAEYALGWLGWSEEQALSADVNAIRVGLSGRLAMLKAIFGSGEADEPPRPAATVSARPLTPELFRAMFSK